MRHLINRAGLFLLTVMAVLSMTNLNAQTKLMLAAGKSLPPYVIEEKHAGIEVDIVREAFKKTGYSFTLDHVPFKRVPLELKLDKISGAFTMKESQKFAKYFFSEPYITYTNVAISLKKSNLSIKNFSDLKNKRVVAFQNAKVFLGQDYVNGVKDNKKYREIAKQELQIALLYKGRADVIIMDRNIFEYFKNMSDKINTNEELVFHEIFPKTDYQMAFKSKKIRDDFNKGLKYVKKNKIDKKIIKKYTTKK